MSPGALRHYLSTKDEMLIFIMDYFSILGKNVQMIKKVKDPLQAVEEILLELVPIDEEKKIEASVWWIFALRSLTSEVLKEKRRIDEWYI